jgi:hypothetical protein
MAEAAQRAQASFSHYRARHGGARGVLPGQLTVQELQLTVDLHLTVQLTFQAPVDLYRKEKKNN